jgi:hypothetical protein
MENPSLARKKRCTLISKHVHAYNILSWKWFYIWKHKLIPNELWDKAMWIDWIFCLVKMHGASSIWQRFFLCKQIIKIPTICSHRHSLQVITIIHDLFANISCYFKVSNIPEVCFSACFSVRVGYIHQSHLWWFWSVIWVLQCYWSVYRCLSLCVSSIRQTLCKHLVCMHRKHWLSAQK